MVFRNPPCVGPQNQNVGSSSLCGLLGRVLECCAVEDLRLFEANPNFLPRRGLAGQDAGKIHKHPHLQKFGLRRVHGTSRTRWPLKALWVRMAYWGYYRKWYVTPNFVAYLALQLDSECHLRCRAAARGSRTRQLCCRATLAFPVQTHLIRSLVSLSCVAPGQKLQVSWFGNAVGTSMEASVAIALSCGGYVPGCCLTSSAAF